MNHTAPTPNALATTLTELAGPVVVRYYTSDVDSWYTRAERALLETIAGASPKIALEVHADRWDPAREAAVAIRRTPAIALAGEDDTGIRYYGMPDGYELEVFLGLIRAIAARRPDLQPRSITTLRALAQPVHLEVLVSPT